MGLAPPSCFGNSEVCSFCRNFPKLCGAPGFWENVFDDCSYLSIDIAYSNFHFLWRLHGQFSGMPQNFSKTREVLDPPPHPDRIIESLSKLLFLLKLLSLYPSEYSRARWSLVLNVENSMCFAKFCNSKKILWKAFIFIFLCKYWKYSHSLCFVCLYSRNQAK